MVQRQAALSAKKWYIRDNPKATGYTATPGVPPALAPRCPFWLEGTA